VLIFLIFLRLCCKQNKQNESIPDFSDAGECSALWRISTSQMGKLMNILLMGMIKCVMVLPCTASRQIISGR